MKDLLIKVCGMRDTGNIKKVLRSGIDLMGFVFYKSSQRYTEIIPAGIEFDGISKVGVFVNSPIKEVVKKAIGFDLDFLQLHGEESPGYCKKLKSQNNKIIKAFSVNDDFDFKKCEEYTDAVDYFLFDTKGKLKGGNGKTFNWKILDNYVLNKPFILSGGIGLEHLTEIKKMDHLQLAGIDLNSGFEIIPGIKDYNKLKRFINELRSR